MSAGPTTLLVTIGLGLLPASWWHSAHAAVPPGVLVDRVAAVVDREIISESELLTEARVALAWRQGERAAGAELSVELMLALRDYVISQALVSTQARRMALAEVSTEELERRAWQFRQRFASNTSYFAFLRRFGIAEATVFDILRRDLQNEKTIEQRMRTRMLGAGTGPDHYDVALKNWLAELRQGVDIRLLGEEGELEPQRHD